MLRSATGAGVSVSVALLLPGLGSVVPGGSDALVVLTRLPVALGLMAATTVKVAVPPTARLTLALMSPEPLAGPLEPVPVYVAVQAALVMPNGRASVTVAPVTALGPLLVTTIV